MNLNIKDNQFQNIAEIWVTGTNSVEVVTKKDNRYRIIAEENIRSGATPKYFAAYEQLKSVNIDNENYDIWTRDISMPHQDGETIESCIQSAISWVDERR